MLPQQTISQPAWVNNIRLLQQKIYAIIGKYIPPDRQTPNGETQSDLNSLLDEIALRTYWIPALTHKSVEADPTKNYETFEFYGDKAMNYAFTVYIHEKFGNRINQANGTLLLNRYMSKQFQAEMAERLGLVEMVRFDPSYPSVNINVKEDVTEAFFGALSALANDRIQKGFGFVYVSNVLTDYLDSIPIDLESIQRDPITKLKETFEKMGWGTPNYVKSNTDNPQLGEIKFVIRGRTGEELGVGYGSEKRAKAAAAEDALRSLEEKGITEEVAERVKLENQRSRNADFNRQYVRVERAIDTLNDMARKRGGPTISEFKIENLGSHKVEGMNLIRYTYAINAAYRTGDNKLTWQVIHQLTGNDSEKTKIDLMKELADKYRIPTDI